MERRSSAVSRSVNKPANGGTSSSSSLRSTTSSTNSNNDGEDNKSLSRDFHNLLQRAAALEKRRGRVLNLPTKNQVEPSHKEKKQDAPTSPSNNSTSSSKQKSTSRGSVRNLVSRFEPSSNTRAAPAPTATPPAFSFKVPSSINAAAPSASQPRSSPAVSVSPYRDTPYSPARPSSNNSSASQPATTDKPAQNLKILPNVPAAIVDQSNTASPKRTISTGPTTATTTTTTTTVSPATISRSSHEYQDKFRILNDPTTSPSEKLRMYLQQADAEATSPQRRSSSSDPSIELPTIPSPSASRPSINNTSNRYSDNVPNSSATRQMQMQTTSSSQLPNDTLDMDVTMPWEARTMNNVIWNYDTSSCYSDTPTSSSGRIRMNDLPSRWNAHFVDVDIGHDGDYDNKDIEHFDFVEDDDEIFQDEHTAADEFLARKRKERKRLAVGLCVFLATIVVVLVLTLAVDEEVEELNKIRPWTGECFENKIELRMAVDRYLQDNSPETDLAQLYGWPMNSWCVSKIEDFSNLFRAEVGDGGSPIRIATFDEDISGWDVSNAKLMTKMFLGAPVFNSDLSKWNVTGVLDMERMFADCPSFSSDLSSWDVSSVTNAKFMFHNAKQFNSDLSKWKFAPNTMDGMFSGAERFSSDLNNFDVSKVTNFAEVFAGATSFDGDISQWNMERAERLDSMFDRADVFDGDLSKWKLSPRSIGSMFFLARSFTGRGGLENWDMSGVDDMHAVFYGSKFQGSISSWNLGSTTTTRQMFDGASSFDGDISNWDVSKVRDFTSMFEEAKTFASDISSWNVSSGLKFNRMFANATSFNSNLSNWTVSSAETLTDMFADASIFSHNLCSWGPHLASYDWDGESSSVFEGTNCPQESTNPDYSLSRPGPFCYPCGP
eukprot:scaffold24702_cov137-Cylindrotheca_fusiformis.AAC.1